MADPYNPYFTLDELLKVIQSKDETKVAKLLQRLSNDEKRELFIAAAELGYDVVVKLVFNTLTDQEKIEALNTVNDEEMTVLMSAAEKGYARVVQIILNKLTPQDKDVVLLTTLMLAAQYGHPDVAEITLDQLTPQEKTKIIHAGSDSGITALMLAAQHGHADVAEIILDQLTPQEKVKAIHAEDNLKMTALIWAAQYGHAEVVRTILDNLAPQEKNKAIHAKTASGTNALMWAAHEGYADVAKNILDQLTPQNRVELLNDLDNEGRTALALASSHGYKEVVEVLTSFGATFQRNQSAKIIKDIGHILGVSANFTVKVNGKSRDICSEGNERIYSNLLLSELIEDHIQRLNKNKSATLALFKLIHDSVQTMTEYTKHDEKMDESKFLKRFQAGGCIMIPASYNSEAHLVDELTLAPHSFSVVLYQNYMILTDRGGSSEHADSIQIYNIKNSEVIDEAFIKSLYNCGHTKSSEIQNLIQSKVVDLFTSIPVKAQKHGTCGFVNDKVAIEGILFIDKYQSHIKNKVPDAENKAKEYARTQYKLFTTHIREQGIQEVIDFKNRPNATADDKELAMQLTVEILKAHHGQAMESTAKRTNKMKHELTRAFKLLSSYSESDRKEIIGRINTQDPEIDLPFWAVQGGHKDLAALLFKANAETKMHSVKKPAPSLIQNLRHLPKTIKKMPSRVDKKLREILEPSRQGTSKFKKPKK